jgi:hypothetical protein
VNDANEPFGLGATSSGLECFYGLFENGFLNEFGRMIFENGDIYHGGVRDGAFCERGVYYSPQSNSTSIIYTSAKGETSVEEEKKGYYLVDFGQRIGERSIREDNIDISVGTQLLFKSLENYYKQYIETRRKNETGSSNTTLKDGSIQKLNNIDESCELITKPKRILSLPKELIANEEMLGVPGEITPKSESFQKSELEEVQESRRRREN